MTNSRTSAYDLSESQVTTPDRVVALFWDLTRARRPQLGSVLDMGAGDNRFAVGGHFQHYVGVEIDRRRVRAGTPPKNGILIDGCVFRHRGADYDACIGNPPYVRHHDIESPWKEATVERLEHQLGVVLDQHCNLYLYFMCLGLLKTHKHGLLGLVIPYEWVSRPSARAVREYIHQQRWDVDVYRFKMPIFKDVLTTASISIVDKSSCNGRWSYFDITSNYEVQSRKGVVDGEKGVLDYASPGKITGECIDVSANDADALKMDFLLPEEACAPRLRGARIPTCDMTFPSVLVCLAADHLGGFFFHQFRARACELQQRMPLPLIPKLRRSLGVESRDLRSSHWFAHVTR